MSSSSLSAPTTLVLLQPGFRCLCDPAERLRSDAQIDRPEGADAEGGNADAVALEELDDATQRLGRRRRRDDLDLGEIGWAGALGAHPLRSAGLDAAEHGWIGCGRRAVRVERIGECAHCVG